MLCIIYGNMKTFFTLQYKNYEEIYIYLQCLLFKYFLMFLCSECCPYFEAVAVVVCIKKVLSLIPCLRL